jgi:hypothetical protein
VYFFSQEFYLGSTAVTFTDAERSFEPVPLNLTKVKDYLRNSSGILAEKAPKSVNGNIERGRDVGGIIESGQERVELEPRLSGHRQG